MLSTKLVDGQLQPNKICLLEKVKHGLYMLAVYFEGQL